MLQSADVQALFAVPIGTPTSDHLGDCTWPLADPSLGDGLDVVVNVGPGSQQSLRDDMGTTGLTHVNGVGDQADWDLLAGYIPHLGASKAQDTCELTVGNKQVNAPTSGKDVFTKIDATALPGFMAKVGALCTAIFTGLGV